MGSREDRIMNLATTLKASGLAKSEVQARMMAEEMIGVEENVQKSYEEEHTKAHEYLKTAKNLGTPRFREQPKQEQQEQKPRIEPIGTRIQPIQSGSSQNTLLKSVDESVHEKRVNLEPVHTDVDFGKGTLKDMMLNQIKADNHEIKTIEQLEDEVESGSSSPIQGAVSEPAKEDPRSEEAMHSTEKKFEDLSESSESPSIDENSQGSSEEIAPKLDGDKLREMMEEDGPMEEHTREIKEKPKDVKPKEEYVENTVDLSSMFNVNKK
jgi:hypothetical protein